MAEVIIPKDRITALVDLGDELSAEGERVVSEALVRAGYCHALFMPAHEMDSYVTASSGVWADQARSRPLPGWSYYRRVDAEEIERGRGRLHPRRAVPRGGLVSVTFSISRTSEVAPRSISRPTRREERRQGYTLPPHVRAGKEANPWLA